MCPRTPSAAIRLHLGDGAGNFTPNIVESGFDNHESKLGDIDGDGDLDIVGKPFNIGAPGVNLWLNDGIDRFSNWDRSVLDDPAPHTPLFVHHADIDGDGFVDVVTGGWWYRNPGAAGGDWTRATIGTPLTQVAAVADLDGDGDLDVIGNDWMFGVRPPTTQFSWGRNNGSGAFDVFPVVETADFGRFLQGAELARLTPGGPLELVMSWHDAEAGTRTIVIPDDLLANPSQAPWTETLVSTFSEGEQIAVEDIDGDGDNDIFTGNNWLRNDIGSWATVSVATPRTGLPDRVVLGDIDGDGDRDSVIGNEMDPSGELSWYERPSDPAGTWTHHLIANLVNPQSVDVADIDGDGDLDVVVGEHNIDALEASRLLVYENLGAGGAWNEHLIYVGDEHHDGAQLVDLDNDGDLDVISIGYIQNRVVVYYNRAGD